MAPAKSLFDDNDDNDLEREPQLRVNEDYAKRFEHNKKREELHRLQEKYPEQAAKLARQMERKAAGAAVKSAEAQEEEEEEESSSDGEDDDEGVIDEKTQAQIFETILKIRQRDQSIYDANAKFYSSESEEDEEPAEKKEKTKKERPMYLKDVIYQQAVEGGADSSDEDGDAGAAARQQPRTYAQEQQELKQAFLSAFEENVGAGEGAEDGFGAGVLQERPKKKKKGNAAAAAGGEGSSDEGEAAADGETDAAAAARVQQLLDGYFGRDEQLSAEDKFLKRYILNKGWVEEGDDDGEDYAADELHGTEQVDDEEDEEFVEKAEEFEVKYNFRFEEPGGATIVTHPRNIEGTVRKSDDRRKRARAEKAARQAAEEEQRRAEVKRLKNLKKAEIEEKLQEIQSVAGRAAPKQEVLDALVAGDFDPEEYDRQMAAAFGDDYYAAGGDEEEDDDLVDEEFERELEAMAQYGSDDEAPASFAALHKRLAAQRAADAAGKEDEEEEDGEGGDAAADPEAAARARAEVQRLLEEYYKLDYEDVVGGIPTRFRYKEVPADTFGLSVEEVLALDDRELNQVVGLKRLAPYREEHRAFRPNYQKINQLRKDHAEQLGQRQGGSGKGWGRQQQQQRQQQGRTGPNNKPKWKQQQQDGQQQQRRQHKAQQEGEAKPQKTAEQRRLESFAKPTLKKGGQQQQQLSGQEGGKKRKREQQASGSAGGKGKPQQPQQQQQQAADDGPKLSKAQKKNMKRAEKRAQKRAKTGGSGEEA